jgi:hypothetical protein
LVGAKLVKVEFRIAAAKIEGVEAFGKRGIHYWAKRDDLCAIPTQEVKIIFVVKAECLISRHTDADARLLSLRADRRFAFEKEAAFKR